MTEKLPPCHACPRRLRSQRGVEGNELPVCATAISHMVFVTTGGVALPGLSREKREYVIDHLHNEVIVRALGAACQLRDDQTGLVDHDAVRPEVVRAAVHATLNSESLPGIPLTEGEIDAVIEQTADAGSSLLH